MNAFVIADPGMAAALLSRGKSEMRVPAHSPLASVVPGDRIQVREACIPARIVGGKLHATARRRAELVVFADGWRQHRDGSHERGRRPTDSYSQWLGAMHMPAWATRLTLAVESARPGRLREMTRADARAEGVMPSFAGLLWRWPKPINGHHLDPRRAFRAHWDLIHAPGDRWDDDPDVVTIAFRVERGVTAIPPRHGEGDQDA
ncbi:hypothetical protein [Sphingomonas sp.]|uniref:hypothetical protein n=1 Tax=Sphingomonas sp. TaxID=28214 RepID=UPI0025D484C1|nr:hypothetical protein [Sphingomonas sp.]